jgi:TetR/AcrR family transcriptional regulator, mexJK operon transcriptional repressor
MKRRRRTTEGGAAGRAGDAARRDEILDAAFAVFADNGFGGTTMLDIAQRAQASKETLYAWFGNKDRLFEELLRARLERIWARATPEALAETADIRARLTALARQQLATFTDPEYIALFRIFTSEAPRSPALRRIIRDTLNRKALADVMADYRARGWLDFDAEPERVAAIFLRMVESNWVGLLFYKIIDRVPESAIVAHAELIAHIFLDGLAPAAGQQTSRRRAMLKTGSTEIRPRRRRTARETRRPISPQTR